MAAECYPDPPLTVEDITLYNRFANRFSIFKTARPGAFQFNRDLNLVMTEEAGKYFESLEIDSETANDTNLTSTWTVPDGKRWTILEASIKRGQAGTNQIYIINGALQCQLAYQTASTFLNINKSGIKIPEAWDIELVAGASAGANPITNALIYIEEDLF